MKKQTGNLEFIQRLNFEHIESLKENGTNYMLIFDNSCERICNSKVFVNFATAGRLRGLCTISIKQNLFHQSKLGQDVDLEDTHIVHFTSPSDAMQDASQ